MKNKKTGLVDWSEWSRLLDTKPNQKNFINGKEAGRYIGGYKTFIDQLKAAMPFLKETLPRIIKRDL